MGKNHSTNRERSYTARKKHRLGRHKDNMYLRAGKRIRAAWYRYCNENGEHPEKGSAE